MEGDRMDWPLATVFFFLKLHMHKYVIEGNIVTQLPKEKKKKTDSPAETLPAVLH